MKVAKQIADEARQKIEDEARNLKDASERMHQT